MSILILDHAEPCIKLVAMLKFLPTLVEPYPIILYVIMHKSTQGGEFQEQLLHALPEYGYDLQHQSNGTENSHNAQ